MLKFLDKRYKNLKKLPQDVKKIIYLIIAFTIPIINLAIALLMDPNIVRDTPSLFFFPSVALSAWFGGYITGSITAVISAILMDYIYIAPFWELNFNNNATVFKMFLFSVEGIVLSFLIDKGKRKNKYINLLKKEKLLVKQILYLTEQNEKAQKEIRSRDEFLSIASHELKTPLTSMLLQTQRALYNIRNVSLAHFSINDLLKMLESVENQTRRLSKMINDLLNISLITTGTLKLEYQTLDLGESVRNVIQEFSARLKRDNIKINFEERDKIKGRFDKVRVEQSLSNLISNAIKYGNEKPINITQSKKDSKARISVTDNGIGIPKEKQKKIFELFERGVSTEKYRGLGVGLFIAEEIVKAHGGTVLMSSERDKGTTFTMELPIKKAKRTKITN